MAGNRLTSGVTLNTVHQNMTSALRCAGIMDPSAVLMVTDDEKLPHDIGPHQQFISVRLPSFTWADGDSNYGGNDGEDGTVRQQSLAEFIVLGQSRTTLWLNNDSDLYGAVDSLALEAAGPNVGLPGGNSLIAAMVKLFFEQDLMDASPWVTRFNVVPEGDYILKRCMKFISYEPPPPGSNQDWRPFRITWEVKFTWDLTANV